ncbi:MAG: hypothetical protein RR847_01830 [Bacilli bacterium]
MIRKEVSDLAKIGEEPRGFSKKYWVEEEIKKLLKYNNDIDIDQDVMEKLSSDILKKVGIDCVNVSLGYNSDINTKCCLVDNFLINKSDVLYDIDIPWATREIVDTQRDIKFCFGRVFGIFYKLHKIEEKEFKKLNSQYIKMIFGDCIIGNEDGKLKNVGLIFNKNTHKYRLAPSFDNALSFNNYRYIDNEPVCYIGNQQFYSKDVIDYIIKNHFSDIKDTTEKLDLLVKNDLYNMLANYKGEIEQLKIIHIINHITDINQHVNKQKKKLLPETKTKSKKQLVLTKTNY